MYEITDFLESIVDNFNRHVLGKPYLLNIVPYDVVPKNGDIHWVHNPINKSFYDQESLDSFIEEMKKDSEYDVLIGKRVGNTTYALIAKYDKDQNKGVIPEPRYKKYFSTVKV